jgi:hypothetical protein
MGLGDGWKSQLLLLLLLLLLSWLLVKHVAEQW